MNEIVSWLSPVGVFVGEWFSLLGAAAIHHGSILRCYKNLNNIATLEKPLGVGVCTVSAAH